MEPKGASFEEDSSPLLWFHVSLPECTVPKMEKFKLGPVLYSEPLYGDP